MIFGVLSLTVLAGFLVSQDPDVTNCWKSSGSTRLIGCSESALEPFLVDGARLLAWPVVRT